MMNEQNTNVTETKYYLLEIQKSSFGFKCPRAYPAGCGYSSMTEVTSFIDKHEKAVKLGLADKSEFLTFTDLAAMKSWADTLNADADRELAVWRHKVYGEPMPR